MSNLFKALILVSVVVCGSSAITAADESWPDTLVIGTAGRGGTYDAYGQGLANVLQKELGLAIATRETTGPDENIQLLERNKIQIGFVTLGAALNALKAAENSTDEGFNTLRAIAPMYETSLHFIVQQRSAINHIEELSGKTIGVGPAGGTADVYVPRILKAFGVDASYKVGEWASLGSQLGSGQIEMLAVAGGTPFPALLELSQKLQLRFLEVGDEEAKKLRLLIPELDQTVVAAGVYPWHRTAYRTVGMFNFVLVRQDLPYSLVEAMVNAIFTRNERIIEFSPAAAETIPRNVNRNNVILFHAGAISWYQRHFPSLGGGD